MGLRLSIRRRDALSIVLSGLTAGESALLQTIFLTSDRMDRPGFSIPEPGAIAIHGSPDQMRACAERLASDGRLLDSIRSVIVPRLVNSLRSGYSLSVGGTVLDLGARTHVMGVLNVTPDSFSDGGRFFDPAAAVDHGCELVRQGADLLDIGGESTRPGAEPLPEDEELRRIIPVIERLAQQVGAPLSVDTYKARVAERALRAGASIVNDISGLRFSPDMARIVADNGAAVIVMHIKGTPRDMQHNPVYEEVVGEILDSLEESANIALRAGVPAGRILVDPGIGFGKTADHNLAVLDRLDEFRALGFPLVLGTSRKRFIGAVLGGDEPRDRVEGTAATVSIGIERGAQIVRVHDVEPMVKVARMTDAIVRAISKH